MYTYTCNLDNGFDDFDIECEYEYQPFEPTSRHYPGCAEFATIYRVTILGTDIEIELMPKVQSKIEDEILEYLAQDAMERAMDQAEYQYEMAMERMYD